ncbi:NAD-dependent epimerase/dehydratase family protein [Castellaniella sp. S9]|uniref:NAD-dependent epimerase/dehydratase family protein n=1 Tax=Castellaniella sp. S9 TaxID=2993652 RepID=UPI0022B55556|nr:NAD(P)-dependent oxidoreductase [Castellaniella sp. S9]
MKVCVTGATGFVGINIVEELLGQGHSVALFDVAPLPAPTLAELDRRCAGMEMRVGDIRDIKAVEDVLAGADAVVHSAAITPGPHQERDNPQDVVSVNVIGTVNVLAAARAMNIRRMVHISSPSVYGINSFIEGRLDEDTPVPIPDSLYAITKYAAERLVIREREKYGFDAVCLRPGYVFGPWERDTGVRGTLSPIWQVTRQAMLGEEVVLPRACVRDWAYSRDVGCAVAALLGAERLRHGAYNLSGPKSWDLQDWCEALRTRFKAFGYRVGSDSTIDLFQDRDRSPMVMDRLLEDTGFKARFDLGPAFADYMSWLDHHSDVVVA